MSFKILVFSDIHFGEQLNSPLKLDIAKKNIEFITNIVQEQGIKDIVFCGDWFHSRNSISVNTFFQSYEALKNMMEQLPDAKLYMIVGNHDSYYKNTIKVHSLKSFEQISNVVVIDKPIKEIICGKSCLLAPWGTDIQQYKNKNFDLAFGHFDPNGAVLTGAISSGCAYGMEDLTDIAPLVFSGHYHISKSYPTEKGEVLMVGSPSQQNWGDIGTKRGCYIYDTKKEEYSFIENTQAPIHNKFLYSEMIETKKLPPKSEIENNFIKLIIDCAYKYPTIQKLLEQLQKAKPCTLEPEYYYTDQVKLNLNNTTEKKHIKTHAEYIEDYVLNKMEDIEGIKKDKLLELVMSIYSRASTEE